MKVGFMVNDVLQAGPIAGMARVRLPQVPAFAIVFVLAIAGFMLFGRPPAGTLVLHDSDDAMRLATIRALIEGQAFFDLAAHRLDPLHGGVIMHWSRLIDAPIAGLILLFRLFFSPEKAEWLALVVWPLGLLLPAFYLASRILKSLGADPVWPGLMLLSVTIGITVQFAPMRIDHHGAQIVLLLAMIAAASGTHSALSGAACGAAAALSLTIGLENLPFVAALGGLGLLQLVTADPGDTGRADYSLWLALALALLMAVFGAVFVPSALLTGWLCDTLSPFYVMGGFGVAMLFCGLHAMAMRGIGVPVRLAAAGLAGAVMAAGLFWRYPACGAGPLGELDPLLQHLFLATINEAQSMAQIAADKPERLFMLVLPLAGLVATGLMAWRADAGRRWKLLGFGLFLLLGTLTGLMQVRAMIAPASLGALIIGVACARLIQRDALYRATALFLCALMPLQAIAFTLALGDPERINADERACYDPAGLTALSSLTRSDGHPLLVLADRNLGAHLLAFTPHAVLYAPYHRAERAILAAEAIFAAAPAQAARLMREEGIDLIVTCPALASGKATDVAHPGGFHATLSRAIVPEGFQAITPSPEGFVVLAPID